MAVRIEYLLALVFVILAIAVFGFNPTSKEAVVSKGDKEVQFTNFQIYMLKVDDSGREIHASEATKYKNYIDFKEVNLTDELGHELYSKKAIYKDNAISLNERVKLIRDDGTIFSSDNLDYDLKEKVITTQKPFLLEYNKTVIRGNKLEVDVKSRMISAYAINASVWFEEK